MKKQSMPKTQSKISNASDLAKTLEQELKKRGISEQVKIRHSQPINEYEVVLRPFQKKLNQNSSQKSEHWFVQALKSGVKNSKPKSNFPDAFRKGKVFQILGLAQWLRDAEQIPEEGESVEEFIKRTGWTLEKENYWRKIAGQPLLKSEEEYRKLFEENKIK